MTFLNQLMLYFCTAVCVMYLLSGGYRAVRDFWRRQIVKGPLRESAPVSQPEATRRSAHSVVTFLTTPFNEKIPMSEITSLVTAEAVKEVLRSEEVLSALKQKLRQNLEARLDAEVDAILDELLGVPAVPEPEGIADDSTVSDGVGSQPDGSEEPQPDGEMMM